jgi:hypothetical protein
VEAKRGLGVAARQRGAVIARGRVSSRENREGWRLGQLPVPKGSRVIDYSYLISIILITRYL